MTFFSLYHFMPVPLYEGDPVNMDWTSFLGVVLWMLPFAVAYFWHLYHDHKHNHRLEKRMDEITELLRKILEK